MNEKIIDAPFTTQNRALAYALAVAGCTFAPMDSGGPAQNIYSIETLRARRVGKGKTLEEAAHEAMDRQIPGNVTWLFIRNFIFQKAIAAWDEMDRQKNEAETEGEKPSPPDIDPATVMQVMYVYVNSIKELAKVPFIRRALVSTITSKTTEAVIKEGYAGVRHKTVGKGRVYTLPKK